MCTDFRSGKHQGQVQALFDRTVVDAEEDSTRKIRGVNPGDECRSSAGPRAVVHLEIRAAVVQLVIEPVYWQTSSRS